MPVQTDAPTGIGVWDEWGLWGSAPDKISAVATNDGDTSVIYAASGGRHVIQVYTFPFLGGIGDPVTSASVTAIVREYAHGAGHLLHVLWNDTEGTFGVDFDFAPAVHAAGGAYTTCTTNAAGAGLAVAAVNGSHSVDFQGAGGTSNKAEFWVTQFYRTVNYGYGAAPAAGDFTHNIGAIVGALIGGNLLLREMPAVSALMRRKAGWWLRPDEYEAAWRAWRAQKHAVWI